MIENIIKENFVKDLGALINSKKPSAKCFYIIDKNINHIYSDIFSELLVTEKIVIESSESNKDFSSAARIYDKLIAEKYTRDDYIVSVGGGIIGDLSAFVASTFMRGMKYICVPTSLLSMVDSSIGGKTGFNYGGLKNMIGTFYEAERILIDTSFLLSLPKEEVINGMAEIIKIAMVADSSLFEEIENCVIKNNRFNADLSLDFLINIISKAQKLKEKIVIEDLRDHGSRHSLNFGHSLGHAIESASEGKIKHGYAVAMGMAEITRVSVLKGLSEKRVNDRLIALLENVNLPTKLPFDINILIHYIMMDKKRSNKVNKIVICDKIGHFNILELSDSDLRKFLIY